MSFSRRTVQLTFAIGLCLVQCEVAYSASSHFSFLYLFFAWWNDIFFMHELWGDMNLWSVCLFVIALGIMLAGLIWLNMIVTFLHTLTGNVHHDPLQN